MAGSVLIGVISEEHSDQRFSKSGTSPASGHGARGAAANTLSTVDFHLKAEKAAALGC